MPHSNFLLWVSVTWSLKPAVSRRFSGLSELVVVRLFGLNCSKAFRFPQSSATAKEIRISSKLFAFWRSMRCHFMSERQRNVNLTRRTSCVKMTMAGKNIGNAAGVFHDLCVLSALWNTHAISSCTVLVFICCRFKVEVVDNRERERKLRREIANSNERRRMQSINSGFQALRLLIPHSEGEKLSKVFPVTLMLHSVKLLSTTGLNFLLDDCSLIPDLFSLLISWTGRDTSANSWAYFCFGTRQDSSFATEHDSQANIEPVRSRGNEQLGSKAISAEKVENW